MTRSPTPSRAFSLIELTIVVAIVAIIAAVGVPRYSAAVARYRADAAIRRIATDIARTRQLARMTSSSQTIAFNIAANTYAIAAETSLAANQAGSTVLLAQEPYHATLTKVELGGANVLQFNGFGYPATTGAVTLTVGSLSRGLSVDATGAVTITP